MTKVPLLDLQKVIDGFAVELDQINILNNAAALRADPNCTVSDYMHGAIDPMDGCRLTC